MSKCSEDEGRVWGKPTAPTPLPDPTQVGQVLYAATVLAFTIELPMIGPTGWLVSGGKLLVK